MSLPVASETPSPVPTESPSPEPTEEPSPEPVAPTWSLKLSSSVDLGTGSFERVSSLVSGKARQQVNFKEVATAPRSDRTGNQIGWVHVEYSGGVHESSSGMVGLGLSVDSTDGTYRFEGTGVLLDVADSEEEGPTYVFSGSYALLEQPVSPETASVDDVLLHGGTFELRLRFWVDGKSLYSTSLKLTEA
jgi:hypothetical protein